MEVSELEGAELDYWVAKAEQPLEAAKGDNWEIFIENGECHRCQHPGGILARVWWHTFSPSTNWSQGGPIIEREKIQLVPMDNGDWAAYKVKPEAEQEGQTPLKAAMRCYVSSKFGEEV